MKIPSPPILEFRMEYLIQATTGLYPKIYPIESSPQVAAIHNRKLKFPPLVSKKQPSFLIPFIPISPRSREAHEPRIRIEGESTIAGTKIIPRHEKGSDEY